VYKDSATSFEVDFGSVVGTQTLNQWTIPITLTNNASQTMNSVVMVLMGATFAPPSADPPNTTSSFNVGDIPGAATSRRKRNQISYSVIINATPAASIQFQYRYTLGNTPPTLTEPPNQFQTYVMPATWPAGPPS